MRILTPEYLEALKHNETYNYILNTPKPDFTELDKECEEFATWLRGEHEKERALLRKMEAAGKI